MFNKHLPFRSRFALPALITMILLIVLGNNISERYRMKELSHSFDSVIRDRLRVEGYIFRISTLLHDKAGCLSSITPSALVTSAGCPLQETSTQIRHLLADYEATYLTEKEELLFASLKKELSTVASREEALLAHQKNDTGLQADILAILGGIERSSGLLSDLSDIQLVEGKRLSDHSHRLILAGASSSQFELTLLVILGLIIQLWLIASRSIQHAIRPRDVQLN